MWLLTVLPSTAELSKTLVGVFLPGTQAGLVAGVPVLLLTPLKLRTGLGGAPGPPCVTAPPAPPAAVKVERSPILLACLLVVVAGLPEESRLRRAISDKNLEFP